MAPHTLLIDDKVPDPVFGAGFPRAYKLLLSLIELGHKISFFPTNRQSVVNLDREALRKFDIEVVDDIKDLHNLDMSIISRPHNVHYYLPILKKWHPNAKFIYDTEALWYRRYDLQLAITGKLPWWAYRYDELGLAKQADLCFVVNHEEKVILESNEVKKVVVLAHALDIHLEGKYFEDRKDYLVVGGILEEDSSNEDAVWWYMTNCWQKVNSVTGGILNITGHRHTERLLKNDMKDVSLSGLVPNLVPLYESHRLFMASTRFATGIPWRVHEAMAHGCPCVISTLLANQLGVTTDREAMVADNADEFINKSIALYSDPSLWKTIRDNAFNLVRRDCNPNRFTEILRASLAELF